MAILGVLREFRQLDRRVLVLAVSRMVVMLGFAAVLPFLAVSLHKDRGVPMTTVGAIWTTAGLAGAAMQWVAGEIADRIGRRPLLLGGLLLRTTNLAVLGHLILVRGPILGIAALVVANSVLRAFVDPVAAAMVADLAPGERRIAAFSLQRIGVNVGWAIGNMAFALSETLQISYGHLFYAAATITLLATVAAAPIPETVSRGPRAKVRPPFRPADVARYLGDRRLVLFLAATFFFFLLQVQLYAPLSIYAESHLHLARRQIAHFYSENGALVVALQVPAVLVIRRAGTGRALFYGALVYAAAYALCGAATIEAHLLACVALITAAEVVSAPAQQTTAAGLAPEGQIGAYTGLYGLAQQAGQSLGPLVGTSLLQALPDRLAWPLVGACGVVAALLYRRAR